VAHYLVTGGAGFIGSHLAERLLRDGHRVRVLDNLSTGRVSNLEAVRAAGPADRLEWIEGDIRSLETCRRATAGVEFVLHQAALASVPRSIENPIDSTAVNVGGTLNVFHAARDNGVKRVVAASSSSVYGDAATLPKHEEQPTAPLSPYAASKLAGEIYARVYAVTMGLSTVSLRYFNVFGPRQDPNSQYAAVVPRFVTALRNGQRPVVYGDGLQSRDFTFIDNVVAANLAACTEGPGGGEAMNIACGDRYTLLQLLDVIGRLLGVTPDPEFQPARPGDVKHSQASIELAQRLIGYKPAVGFEEGLARTVESFQPAG
jgi:UDP-glucose 4-epimerase